MDFGIAETGIARGSSPGTTTEVLRFGVPFAEIRVVSEGALWFLATSEEKSTVVLVTPSIPIYTNTQHNIQIIVSS
jgi:hypothetical protein